MRMAEFDIVRPPLSERPLALLGVGMAPDGIIKVKVKMPCGASPVVDVSEAIWKDCVSGRKP